MLNIFVNYLSDHISRSESEMVDLEGRQPVLLYVQGHMDTLLILVLDSLSRATKDNINKLVRCLLLWLLVSLSLPSYISGDCFAVIGTFIRLFAHVVCFDSALKQFLSPLKYKVRLRQSHFMTDELSNILHLNRGDCPQLYGEGVAVVLSLSQMLWVSKH